MTSRYLCFACLHKSGCRQNASARAADGPGCPVERCTGALVSPYTDQE